MKSIAELRLAADQRKSDFIASIAEVKTQLKPDYVFDEALRIVDPDFAILKHVHDRAKKNPFALLAAFGGIYLLARQLMTKPEIPSPRITKHGKRSRLVRSTSKGDDHGDLNSATRI
jgi:hypothetical protein